MNNAVSMMYTVVSERVWGKGDLVVVPWHKGGKVEESYVWDGLPEEGRSYLSRVIADLKGDWLEMEKVVMPYDDAPRLLVVGLGEKKAWSARKLVLASRKIMQVARGYKPTSLVCAPHDFAIEGISLAGVTEVVVQNMVLAGYKFEKYKTKNGKAKDEEDVSNGVPALRIIANDDVREEVGRAAEVGDAIGGEINAVRDLINTPGGDMTPCSLAQAARAMVEQDGVAVTTLGEEEMKTLGMGGILGVSRGSSEEAQLIVMEYRRGPESQKPLVFVGKGVTFDSGGLDLKPSSAMDEMHMDMGGAGAVIAAMSVIAKLGLALNVVGIVPAAENMPSGECYRPGDILKSMSGTTIEVVNTDAEGRVILADALTYAERYEPALVVDVATLTGAAIVALGHHASAFMTPHEGAATDIAEAAEVSGDYAWRLPLWEEYESSVKGDVGDVINASKSREAGTINGGMFLYQFAKKFPAWAHIDIASTMTGSSDQFLAKGASGAGARLLIALARLHAGRVQDEVAT